jgi:hypothetical protein
MASDQLLEEVAGGHGRPLSQITRLFPPYRRNRPVTLSCVLRWVLEGVRGPGGGRVRLEAARLAGRWVSTQQAVQRFLAAQNPDPDTRPAEAPRSLSARRRASDRAGEELDRIGIK